LTVNEAPPFAPPVEVTPFPPGVVLDPEEEEEFFPHAVPTARTTTEFRMRI
jgi:hypothetical protein